jgi:hypothetical protein
LVISRLKELRKNIDVYMSAKCPYAQKVYLGEIHVFARRSGHLPMEFHELKDTSVNVATADKVNSFLDYPTVASFKVLEKICVTQAGVAEIGKR